MLNTLNIRKKLLLINLLTFLMIGGTLIVMFRALTRIDQMAAPVKTTEALSAEMVE